MSAQSQAKQDSLLAEHYYYLADSTYYNPDTCLKYSKLAIPLLKKAKLLQKYVYTLNGMTYCYKELVQPDKYRENVTYCLSEAQKYLSTRHPEYFYAKLNMASYEFEVIGHYKKATATYIESLEHIPLKNHQDRGTINNNIGKAYEQQGDYKSAISYLENALYLFQKGEVNPIKVYQTTSTLAICYQKSHQPEKALQYFKKAEEIILPLRKQKTQYIAGINILIARAYYQLEQYDSALARVNNADKQAIKNDVQQGNIHHLRGKIFSKKYKIEAALQEFELALSVYPKDNFLDKAKVWGNIAATYQADKQVVKALEATQQSISFLTGNTKINNSLVSLPNASDSIRSEIDLLPVLLQKADILYENYQSNAELKWLEATLETYDYAFYVRSVFQQQLFDERAKLFQNKAQSFQHKAIQIAWELFDKTQQKKYAEKAFAFAEMSKSSVLLEEIKKKEAAGYSNISDTLINQRYDLKGKLNYLQKEVETAKVPKAQLNADVLAIQRQLQAIERELNEKYPAYYKLVHEVAPITPHEIQKNLAENTALLAYYLHDNQLYTFIIQKEGLVFKKQKLSRDLRTQITELLAARKFQNKEERETYQQLGHDLHQILIEPLDLSSDIKKLIIVPDKTLNFLPFELLLTDKTDSLLPKTFPFLFKKYTTAYAYSATILQKQKQSNTAKQSLLAIAPIFDNHPTQQNLTYSEKSSEKIAATFRGKRLIRQEASLKNYRTLAPDYQILHLSTHASAGDSLLPPAIFFHDDTLLLSDVYAMRLNAQLVVLSACQTALGEYEQGEGVMSLSRGFTYAGVPALVSSLWSVNDKSTADIMQFFYQHLRSGFPADEALQQARLDYLAQAKNTQATPYYWGAFIYVGEGHVIQSAAGNGKLWLGLLLVGLLLTCGGWWFFKGKSELG